MRQTPRPGVERTIAHADGDRVGAFGPRALPVSIGVVVVARNGPEVTLAVEFDGIPSIGAGSVLSGPCRAVVSQKMLPQTLRSLERDGLVTRTVTPSVPVRVDYELTALGESLCGILSQLKEWAEWNMPEVDRARAQYDAKN